ncbi:uncharacterized protein STEHIDRAFT_116534 [Stereum hirsutum FP-91666 SS1]|uniref:Uncharacterized protein n=1 Tax=Stereum hirsutum (strain FP-91666) TaxID=721885 RepID=R7RW48_STEHR|nr:uncharacterized protein STEHIDRAFT_116534 [Stereum hirsutum FP-91666 SS1]EIM79494.1 hypothetical protein STEHIDRAFT_116534 [Stereum hirsutum FP-91666 SS1]
MSDTFEWASTKGLTTLRHIMDTILPYNAEENHAYESACVLDGRDQLWSVESAQQMSDERILTTKDTGLVDSGIEFESDGWQGKGTLVWEGDTNLVGEVMMVVDIEDVAEVGGAGYSSDDKADSAEEQDDGDEKITECGGDGDENDDTEEEREQEEEEEEDDMDVDDVPSKEGNTEPTLIPKNRRRSRRSKEKACIAFLLIIAAWAQDKCIQRQTNIVFNGIGAVGTHRDCGRCSAQPSSASAQGPMVIDKVPDNTFQYLQLNQKDRKKVAQKIAAWVREVRLQSARHADLLCIRSSQFLSEAYIDASTSEFHLLTSKYDLKRRLVGWNGRRTRRTVATGAATSESKLRAREFTLRPKGPTLVISPSQHSLRTMPADFTVQSSEWPVKGEREVEAWLQSVRSDWKQLMKVRTATHENIEKILDGFIDYYLKPLCYYLLETSRANLDISLRPDAKD